MKIKQTFDIYTTFGEDLGERVPSNPRNINWFNFSKNGIQIVGRFGQPLHFKDMSGHV